MMINKKYTKCPETIRSRRDFRWRAATSCKDGIDNRIHINNYL